MEQITNNSDADIKDLIEDIVDKINEIVGWINEKC